MLREPQLVCDIQTCLQRKCQLCFQPTSQTACLVNSLLQTLQNRFLQEKTGKEDPPFLTEYQSLNGSQKNQEDLVAKNGFYRLICQTFDAQFQHSKHYRNCKHKQIEKIFISRLEFDSKVLDRICDEVVFQIAQRNFQLQTLIFQIRSFPRTIEETCQQKFQKQKEDSQSSNPRNLEWQEIPSELKLQQLYSVIQDKKTRKEKKIRKRNQHKYLINKEEVKQTNKSKENVMNAQKTVFLPEQPIIVKKQQPIGQEVQQNIQMGNDLRVQVANPQSLEVFNAQFYAFAQMLPLFYGHHQNC